MGQTAEDYDRIRSKELTRHLDAKYAEPTLADLEREEAEQHRAEQAKERAWQDRIDAALSEVIDVQRCLIGGTLDYDAAAGVLIEYLPEISEGLRLLLTDPREEVSRLRHEVKQLTFAVELWKAAKRAES